MSDNNSHTERFNELCSGYVLNALSPQEQAEFEKMMDSATDEEIELYHELQSIANNLAFNTKKVEAPESVRQRLLQVVHEEMDEENEASGGFNGKMFAIAASFALLLVTLTLLFYSFNLSSQLETRNQRLSQQEQRITELQQEIEQKDELLDILQARDVDLISMNGMEASPNGYGKIIWDPEQQQALLQVSNLPAVPAGKEYQLWIIKNNQPISAGLFVINDPNQNSFFKIEQMTNTDDASTNAFAVTLEPQGGMPQPTGDMYLMGNME